MTVVVPDFANLYTSTKFHTNAIHYYPSDDSYTISDRDVNAFIKITRKGKLLWQLGGASPKGPAFALDGTTWQVNHGHQLLPNGNFLFFANRTTMGIQSAAIELALDTTAWKLRLRGLPAVTLRPAPAIARAPSATSE